MRQLGRLSVSLGNTDCQESHVSSSRAYFSVAAIPSQTEGSPCGECGLCTPGFQSAVAGAHGQLCSPWLEVLRHILMVTISYLKLWVTVK